jgi:sulfite exporter TauE/SafE
MSLLITMLPIYLLGNLHCLGMCGPLVMMLGQHRYRYFYFLGRTLSFSLAGLVAGELGAVLNVALQRYQISAFASFLFGGIIFAIGVYSILGLLPPGQQWLAKRLAKFNQSLSLLMLKDQAWPSFLFGFFTIALPCGQTLIVFSACALSGDPLVGLVNGFAFALLTSPSLLLAMNTHRLLNQVKPYYNIIMGVCALFVGGLALLRGFADLEVIPHLVIHPEYHIALY